MVSLANYALVNWAVLGFDTIDEGGLGEVARDWLPMKGPADAEPLEQVVGTWRQSLRNRRFRRRRAYR